MILIYLSSSKLVMSSMNSVKLWIELKYCLCRSLLLLLNEWMNVVDKLLVLVNSIQFISVVNACQVCVKSHNQEKPFDLMITSREFFLFFGVLVEHGIDHSGLQSWGGILFFLLSGLCGYGHCRWLSNTNFSNRARTRTYNII